MSGLTEHESSGPSLKLVFGGIAVLSIVFGVLAYLRYANSEKWVAQGIAQMDEAGVDLDEEGCIDRVIEWHDECDVHGANAAVCKQAVTILMYHCLKARDRAEACCSSSCR